jgi:hypothetical protein
MAQVNFRVDDSFLVEVKGYADLRKISSSDVFRDGARLLMDGGVGDGISDGISEGVKLPTVVESVVKPRVGVNPLVEELRAKMGGMLIRASELGDVGIVNKPFGDVGSSVVGSSEFIGEKGVLLERFKGLLRVSADGGLKEIKALLSGLEDRIDSL